MAKSLSTTYVLGVDRKKPVKKCFLVDAALLLQCRLNEAFHELSCADNGILHWQICNLLPDPKLIFNKIVRGYECANRLTLRVASTDLNHQASFREFLYDHFNLPLCLLAWLHKHSQLEHPAIAGAKPNPKTVCLAAWKRSEVGWPDHSSALPSTPPLWIHLAHLGKGIGDTERLNSKLLWIPLLTNFRPFDFEVAF